MACNGGMARIACDPAHTVVVVVVMATGARAHADLPNNRQANVVATCIVSRPSGTPAWPWRDRPLEGTYVQPYRSLHCIHFF